MPKSVSIAGAALALSLTLVGCGQSATADSSNETTQGTVQESAELTLVGGWTKATDGMTGVFGTLTNPGPEEVTLVGASSPIAGMVELHETVVTGGNMKMQEIEGGFVIPAGGSLELEPGANHIMLMDLDRELLPGEELEITLLFSDGTEKELLVEVRDFAGAIEEYAPGDHDHDHDHDHHDEKTND